MATALKLRKVFKEYQCAYLHDFTELSDLSCDQISLPLFNVRVIQVLKTKQKFLRRCYWFPR